MWSEVVLNSQGLLDSQQKYKSWDFPSDAGLRVDLGATSHFFVSRSLIYIGSGRILAREDLLETLKGCGNDTRLIITRSAMLGRNRMSSSERPCESSPRHSRG
jgi:hypothetical protein